MAKLVSAGFTNGSPKLKRTTSDGGEEARANLRASRARADQPQMQPKQFGHQHDFEYKGTAVHRTKGVYDEEKCRDESCGKINHNYRY